MQLNSFLYQVEHRKSRDNLDLKFAPFWFYFVFLLNLDFLTQALIGACWWDKAKVGILNMKIAQTTGTAEVITSYFRLMNTSQ